MEEIKREAEYKKGKMQVILQFPETSDETARIEKEVKEILKEELQKQMRHRSDLP
ncbi:MAG: hypothetical protein HFH95_00805 [Lachnospiraceae bacterium]|nr:hypothetical protein [uncultured Acetatifactor sp.]MCI8541860.1 hypothetical protein [Lachnospiraceae bacterium]